MSAHAIHYCQEVANNIKKWAIYEPGRNLSCGDLIFFRNGDNQTPGNRPIGSYTRAASAGNLFVDLNTKTRKLPRAIRYCSKGIKYVYEANLQKLKITFANDKDFLLHAVGCQEEFFEEQDISEDRLKALYEDFNWDNHFIVLGVTTANRLMILQAGGASASFELQGPDVHMLDHNSNTDPTPTQPIKLVKQKDEGLTRIWQEDHPVFLSLGKIVRTEDNNYRLEEYSGFN